MLRTKKTLYAAGITIIIFIGILLRILFFVNNAFYVSGDEFHGIYASVLPDLSDLFSNYLQGANFMPAYKYFLRFISSACDVIFPVFDTGVQYKFVFYKLPCLILGILSLPLFYSVIRKIFDNKYVILVSLLFFCANSALINMSSYIKPYCTETFLTLLMLNFMINKSDFEEIKFKRYILLVLFGIFVVYTSLSSFLILECCVLGVFFRELFKRNKPAIFRIVLYETVMLTALYTEYFYYINKMAADSMLKIQWFESGQYYSVPDSFNALNSVINTLYFNYAWCDLYQRVVHLKPIIIFLFLLPFFAGAAYYIFKFITETIKCKLSNECLCGFCCTSAITILIFASFLHVFPFSGRLIVFLIPCFLIIMLKPADVLLSRNKVTGYILISIIVFYFGFIVFTQKSMFDLNESNSVSKETKSMISELENAVSEKDIIIAESFLLPFCLTNNNVTGILNAYSDKNGDCIITYTDKRNNIKTSALKEIIRKKNNVFFVTGDESLFKNFITSELKNEGYKKEKELKIQIFYFCDVFTKNETQ